MFRYLYYSIYNGYKNMGENHIPGFYAVGIITLLQGLPLYSLITIPYLLKYISFKIEIPVGTFFIIALLGVNSLYYLPKNNHKKIINSIETLNKRRLEFIKIVSLIYVILSIGLVVVLLEI